MMKSGLLVWLGFLLASASQGPVLVRAQSAGMGNCSFGVSTNATVCRTGSQMHASCLTKEFYHRLQPRFCHMISYPMFIAKSGAGLAEVEMLDEQARVAFVTSPEAKSEMCCKETYRAFLCAEIFPRCNVSADGIVSRWPTCRSWRCNSFQKRSDVEKRVSGYRGRPCFSLADVGAECVSSTTNPEINADRQVDCTCPIANVTKGKDCVPFQYRATWEDVAQLGGKGSIDVCDDVSAVITSGGTLPAATSLLSLVAAALALATSSHLC